MGGFVQRADITSLGPVLADLLPTVSARSKSVPVIDAVGRVAARSVRAPASLPSHPLARVDGIVLAEAVEGAGYRIAAKVFPGDPVPPAPGTGEAVQVATGAPLPDGFVDVIPVEHLQISGDTATIRDVMFVPASAVGSHVHHGTQLVRAGRLIGPREVGRLAAFGHARVAARIPPKVAVLPIGSELVADAAGHPDANGPVLAAMVRFLGAPATVLPPCPDDPTTITGRLKECTADLILTTGGTAKGERDRTASAINDAGFAIVLDGLSARPGSTTRMGVGGGRVVVSLPGMPGALSPLFAVLVRPVFRHLTGMERGGGGPVWRSASLARRFSERRPVPFLAEVRLEVTRGTVRAQVTRTGGNGCVLLPKGREGVAAGTLLPAFFEGEECGGD